MQSPSRRGAAGSQARPYLWPTSLPTEPPPRAGSRGLSPCGSSGAEAPAGAPSGPALPSDGERGSLARAILRERSAREAVAGAAPGATIALRTRPPPRAAVEQSGGVGRAPAPYLVPPSRPQTQSRPGYSKEDAAPGAPGTWPPYTRSNSNGDNDSYLTGGMGGMGQVTTGGPPQEQELLESGGSHACLACAHITALLWALGLAAHDGRLRVPSLGACPGEMGTPIPTRWEMGGVPILPPTGTQRPHHFPISYPQSCPAPSRDGDGVAVGGDDSVSGVL
jgi:hypothetical protein